MITINLHNKHTLSRKSLIRRGFLSIAQIKKNCIENKAYKLHNERMNVVEVRALVPKPAEAKGDEPDRNNQRVLAFQGRTTQVPKAQRIKNKQVYCYQFDHFQNLVDRLLVLCADLYHERYSNQ